VDIEDVRKFCLSLPHATEGVQWDNDLLFRVGDKMFACVGLDRTPTNISFKVTPEKFDELVERADITPAPYLARYKWVMLGRLDALEEDELRRLLRESYEMVLAKLPAKARSLLGAGAARGGRA
jgi:predicted DNA-binding protein (MmcQ/YjbR family)